MKLLITFSIFISVSALVVILRNNKQMDRDKDLIKKRTADLTKRLKDLEQHD